MRNRISPSGVQPPGAEEAFMLDYVRKRLSENGMILPVSVSFQGGGADTGNLAAIDELGIVLVEENAKVRAIPWTSITTVSFPSL